VTTEAIDDPAIPILLSPSRYSTYLAASSGDQAQAVRLYAWNVAMSSALWGDFHVLEVTLRNAMNDQLCAHFGRADWWDARIPLHPFESDRIRDAISGVRAQQGPGYTPGHVVAELSFGFWTGLLANRYHQRLWVPILQHAFPHMVGTRRDLHRDLERLRRLRNRTAHHEPVFARNLADDHVKTLLVLNMISPAAHAWVAHDSRIPAVLATRQATIHGQVPTSF